MHPSSLGLTLSRESLVLQLSVTCSSPCLSRHSVSLIPISVSRDCSIYSTLFRVCLVWSFANYCFCFLSFMACGSRLGAIGTSSKAPAKRFKCNCWVSKMQKSSNKCFWSKTGCGMATWYLCGW